MVYSISMQQNRKGEHGFEMMVVAGGRYLSVCDTICFAGFNVRLHGGPEGKGGKGIRTFNDLVG